MQPPRIEDVPARLRAMRAEAGHPSYAEIARRIAAHQGAGGAARLVSRATVYDCFRDGRKRFDIDLVLAIVRVLARDETTARAWAAGLAAMGQRTTAAALVTVTDVLPAPSGPFVGRTRELTRLSRSGAAHWVHAMPGAGKTTLAVQAAHAAVTSGAAAGAIIADLRGHSNAGPPADPNAVVRAALRLLGDKSNALSASVARRTLRERLRESRTVLLLDDAASLDQVSGVVAHPSSMWVIVTSRLVPDSTRFQLIDLSLFAPYESLALLDAVAGRGAIEEEPAAAAALLQLTAHQPLAVSLTAARVAARSTWTLSEHLELARTRRANLRLDEPVTDSLALTYQLLPDAAQRLLRVLAPHPVALLDRDSLVALAADLVPDLDGALDVLAEHSLIGRTPSGRLQMHELVRVYAMDVGLELDPPSQRHAAADRLRQSIVDRAWAAQRARSRSRHTPGRSPRSAVTELQMSPEAAQDFFIECADLLLHTALAAAGDDDSAVNLISETIDDALHRAGRVEDAHGLFREALRVARSRGDAEGELRATADLGATLVLMGRVAEAEAVLAAIDGGTPGWPIEAPRVHNTLGVSLLTQGRFDAAGASFEAGISAASEAGDLWGEGLLCNSAALLHLQRGDFAAARTLLGRSIDISAQRRDAVGTARGRVNLAKLLLELDEIAAAETEGRQALDEMKALGYVPGVVVAVSNLAAAVCAQGRFAESAALAESGLTVAREAAMQQSELELIRTLASSRLGSGQLDEARVGFENARELAEQLGDQLAIAACTEDLGDCAQAAGDAVRARELWQQAADAYSHGSPSVEGVRAKLASR